MSAKDPQSTSATPEKPESPADGLPPQLAKSSTQNSAENSSKNSAAHSERKLDNGPASEPDKQSDKKPADESAQNTRAQPTIENAETTADNHKTSPPPANPAAAQAQPFPAQKENPERLNLTFDTSSEKNRNLLYTFIITQLYLLITIGSTTDVHLLLSSSNFFLPVINVGIPVTSFYIFGPILLIVLHFTVLLNLAKHARLQTKWQQHASNRALYFPYIVNLLTGAEGKMEKTLLQAMCNLAFLISPLFLLVAFQVRYADYHSIPTSLFHLALVLLDFWVILFFRKKMLGVFKSFYLRPLLALFILSAGINIAALHLAVISSSTVKNWDSILVENGDFISTEKIRSLHKKYESLRDFRGTYAFFRSWILPIIDIHEKELVKIKGEYRNIEITPDYKNSNKKFWIIYQREDLQGRHLELANLSGATLYNANLRGAFLHDAKISNAKLQGTNLKKVQLQGAALRWAQLQGTDLGQAQLQGAALHSAQLQGADLHSAQLQGADLHSAQLQGADLAYTQLQGANLAYTRLQGAILHSAQLQGANLHSAQLQGANLYRATLQGADLGWTQLQGAYLYQALLEGTYLENTQFFSIQSSTNLFNIGSYGNISITAILKTDKYGQLINNNWKTNKPWEALISELEQYNTNNSVSDAIDRLRESKTHALNFKEESLQALSDQMIKPGDKTGLKNILQIRRELACSDKWIAKRLNNISGGNPLYDKALENHISTDPECIKNNIAAFVFDQ